MAEIQKISLLYVPVWDRLALDIEDADAVSGLVNAVRISPPVAR